MVCSGLAIVNASVSTSMNKYEHKHLTHSPSETSKTPHDLEVNLDLRVNAVPADRAASDFGSQLTCVLL